MSKSIKENFLTKDNGCQIVEVTSERKETAAMNILNQNPKSMWVVQRKLPQYCIINTQFKNYPKVFNRVGFYCWHQYDSNPALIEISYANNREGEWTTVAKVRLAQTSQKQYFKIKEIPVTEMKFLKVTLLQNFGDETTYLNQMQLGYVKEASTMDNSRQKTFSEFVKLTSTQRQLKRALQQIKMLSGQQQILRQTVNKQNQIIVKMQQSIKKMARNLQKMNETQQIQSQKIQQLEVSQKKKSKPQSRQHSREKYSDSEDYQIEDKPLIKQALIKNKNTSKTVNKNTSYTKSNKNSSSSMNKIKEASLNNSKQYSKMQKLLKNKLEIRDSQPSLSQYNSSQDEKIKPQKFTQVVRRLYSLIAQKQKREKQLIRKSQNAN